MMRKLLFYISSIAMVVIFWSAVSNATHSPGAKTGSPADGQNCTKCHSGVAQTAPNWIMTDVPATGYVPGKTYIITLTGTHAGVQRFGFEITAEDASNNKVGTFTITNAAQTQLTNMMEAVTHTGNGLAPSNDSKSWSFDWTAPAAGSGDVTFYAALNAANGNMATSGDVVYITNKTISEDLNVGIAERSDISSFKIYPLPARDHVFVEFKNITDSKIEILDLNGKKLIQQSSQNQIVNRMDLTGLAKGYYIIQLRTGGEIVSKKLIIQ